MDEKLKQLESLLSMFDARDQMWAKYNRQIGNVIAPTVLEALYELFELDYDSVEWVDLQIMENILLLICNVTYDPATTQSAFLHRVDEAQRPETPIQVQRFLRIGVPLAIVFSPKDEIKEFLLRIPVETSSDDEDDDGDELDLKEDIESTHASSPTPSSNLPGTLHTKRKTDVMGFDASELNDDQIKSLLLHTFATGSTKQ